MTAPRTASVSLPAPANAPPLPFTPPLTEVMADLACVGFRREMRPDGTIRYPWVSPNLAEIIGAGSDTLAVASNGSLDVMHWADREAHLAIIRRSAESMARCAENFRVITALGETRWFRGAALPRRLDDGTVVWDGMWMDISPWMRAERQHQTVMDHAEDSIFIVTSAGIDWANAAAERLFGCTANQLCGRCPSELFFDPCPNGFDYHGGCTDTDPLGCFPRGNRELTAVRSDGTVFPFEMTVSEVRNDGQLSLIVIGRDITRRKATELMLQETERRLRSIASNLPGVVFQRVREADGRLTFHYLSQGIREVLGRSPGEILANPDLFFDAMVPEDREGLMIALKVSAQTLEPVHEAVRISGSDGRLRWLRGQSRPRRRDDGIVWDGLLLDVTEEVEERHKAESVIRESEERLRMAFAAASLGIIVVSLDGTIQHFNPAFETITGCSAEDLWGACIHDFIARDQLPAADSLPDEGESFCLFHSPQLADGRERHWRITGTQFAATPSADTPSLLLFIEDVTEITRAAEERRQIELTLQEGQKLEALGRLAGGVAHELNNMLGPILMGAEMIGRTLPLDARNAERITRIIDAAKTGRDIVRNVLAYCRKDQRVLTEVDLASMLAQFATLVSSLLPPTVKVEPRIEVETALVRADAGQLSQIFLNLANNARDAMDSHGVLTVGLTIQSPAGLAAARQARERARTKEDARPNPLADLDPTLPYAMITFTDTGCGMSEKVAAKIFDPFFTTKPVGQGTGLGLSVVLGIVKGMGGEVVVDSQPGEGTVFRILLPLIEPNDTGESSCAGA